MKRMFLQIFSIFILLITLAACNDDNSCPHSTTTLQGQIAATCQAKGFSGNAVCDSCGETVTEGSEIDTVECSFVLTDVVIAAPTCEASGSAKRECVFCGKRGVPSPLAALGHTLSADPTGSENSLSHTLRCTREGCDHTVSEPHAGTVSTEAPSCWSCAYKSGTCTVCGVTYRAADRTQTATGRHLWSEGEIQGDKLVKHCLNEGCSHTTRESLTPSAPIPQPADRIDDTENLRLAMTPLTALKTFTDDNGVLCRIVQGACTDGKYYYVAINDGYSSKADSVSIIRKYDLATGAVVATFENLHIAHANDLCFNPVTNEIIAVHNSPVRQLISIFDADSLEFKRQVTLTLEIYSMAYDAAENCYWVGLSYGYNFAKLDASFNQVGSIYEGRKTDYTKQGMDVDGKYIYFLQYNTNSIIVYNKQGAFVKQLNLPQTAKEAENICHIGDVFYIGYFDGSGGTLYKTILNAPKPLEVSASVNQLTTLNTYTDSTESLCKMAQGSCSDGTYIYLAMNNDNSSGYRSVIYKINPQTGEIIDTYEGFEMGLTNDMAYNTQTGEIVVVHNKTNATKLSVLDADTMELTRTVTLSYNVYAIAYNSVQNCYFLGLSGTFDFALLNTDFEKLATYTGRSSSFTKQGMDCDGTYVYFVQSGEDSNNLVVYKTDGTYVGECLLPKGVGSAQSICHVGNTFYIGYNDPDAGGMLYRVNVTIA